MYTGRGVPQDNKMAVAVGMPASSKGLLRLQYNLGSDVYQRQGVLQDLAEDGGVSGGRRAAEQGMFVNPSWSDA
ncbi:MAG: hypothetical protein ACYYK0_01550 [Candidatus Eutrophobiaceae bacterium]